MTLYNSYLKIILKQPLTGIPLLSARIYFNLVMYSKPFLAYMVLDNWLDTNRKQCGKTYFHHGLNFSAVLALKIMFIFVLVVVVILGHKPNIWTFIL